MRRKSPPGTFDAAAGIELHVQATPSIKRHVESVEQLGECRSTTLVVDRRG
jgi:hypothetical protein